MIALLLDVDCGEKECRGCAHFHGAVCALFDKLNDPFWRPRLPACLSAQARAAAMLAVVDAARDNLPGSGKLYDEWDKRLDAALKAFDEAEKGGRG